MSAGIYNITIEQGADWRLYFTWRDTLGDPRDLTGWSARMQIRENYASKSPLLNLGTIDGSIMLGNTDGTVSIHVVGSTTQGIKVNPVDLVWQDGKEGVPFVYDLEMVDPEGVVKRLLQGAVFFVPEVTR